MNFCSLTTRGLLFRVVCVPSGGQSEASKHFDTRLYFFIFKYCSETASTKKQLSELMNYNVCCVNDLWEWLMSSSGMLSPWVRILGEAVIITKL